MASTNKIRERINVVARELAAELGEVDASMGDCWLDAIESQAVELGDAISVELTRQLAQQHPTQEESTCPKCGKLGRPKGHRQRELIGRRGPVTIAEPEYYCPACRRAFFPDDQRDRR